MKWLREYGWFIVTALALYVAGSNMIFALRHPEMTDTQRFLHTLDALLWR